MRTQVHQIKSLLFVICLHSSIISLEGLNATLFKSSGQFSVEFGDLVESNETVAWGTFENDVKNSGWSFLEIKTFGNFDNETQVNNGALKQR